MTDSLHDGSQSCERHGLDDVRGGDADTDREWVDGSQRDDEADRLTCVSGLFRVSAELSSARCIGEGLSPEMPMPPVWLQTLAAAYVPLSIIAALVVAGDIFVVGRRQAMGIMEAVWPLTMLYWGPIGLIFYFWFGRGRHGGERPMWQATFNGATHCGAGCALGDFIGDWAAYALGFTVFGSELGGKYLFAFVLAYLFGVVFQYFSVAPMRGLGLREGLIAAVKVDTLSLLAYEVGMFAWMGYRAWLYPDLQPTSWSYWLLMQLAMVLGFATTYPVNWWLIRSGIKEKM